MDKTKLMNLLVTWIFALSLFAVLLSACSQTPAPTATQMPELTPTPSPTAVLTLASLPDGGLVYGDPEGRFSLPLIGDWTPVETDNSYGHFTLADPAIELYVVTAESDDLDVGVNLSLAQIGIDASTLSLLPIEENELFPGWTLSFYSLDEEQLVGVLARVLEGATVAFIATGESSAVSSVPASAEVALTIYGFATMPLAEYLDFRSPPPPSTVEEIQDFNYVEFYSGRTKLIGRLILPEGEGPFPAIVVTHGSGFRTRYGSSYVSEYPLRNSGIAVFKYDKRGVGDSGGVFVEGDAETAEWRFVQLADDALAAVAFLQNLQEIQADQIGLMGGSQAGWINPLAASRSDALAFVVTFAGPTISLGEEQYWSELTGNLDKISESKREELSEPLAAFNGHRGFDPRHSIEGISIPGLWVWGDRDGSILARESKAILENIIEAYDNDFSILYYPNDGHAVNVSKPGVMDWVHAQLEEEERRVE